MRQVEAGRRDELALGADPFEEHDQLELEEHDRVDRRTASVGVEFTPPRPDKAQVELGLEVPVEVIPGNELL